MAQKYTVSKLHRNRLYAAERVLRLYQTPIATIADAQKMVDRLWKTKRFQKAFPHATEWFKPEIRQGTGGGSYAYSRDPQTGRPSIRLSRPHMNTAVLWHEVAHHLVFAVRRQWGLEERGHGPVFCSLYMQLVKITMGAEAARALRWTFRSWRVRQYDPRTEKNRLHSAPKNPDARWEEFSKDAAQEQCDRMNARMEAREAAARLKEALDRIGAPLASAAG
jgi:putative metallohydrolase (TIGR04338 family)